VRTLYMKTHKKRRTPALYFLFLDKQRRSATALLGRCREGGGGGGGGGPPNSPYRKLAKAKEKF
jgi:hypothetical protein